MFWKPRLQLWERPHRKWPNPNRYIFFVSKVQILWEGHKIWRKLPPLLEFSFQNFVAFSEYLNFTYLYWWTDVLFLFNTNFSGVLSFRCLGQAHKTWQVSFTISKYQFTILCFLSLLHKLMGNDIRMIIWHKFYEYSRNFQFLRKS